MTDASAIVEALCAGMVVLAAEDEAAALNRLEAAYGEALARGEAAQAAALAGTAVCIVAPSWGDLTPLPEWCSRVRAAQAPTTTRLRLMFLAGRMHADNVMPVPGAASSIAADAAELKRLLFAPASPGPAEIPVVAAEPLFDHLAQSGEGAALDEVASLIRGPLERADPRIAARSHFWLGNNRRLVDAQEAAEAAFATARALSEKSKWYWIRLQLLRAAARPAVEGRDRAVLDPLLAEFETLLRPERPLDWGDYHHLRGWDALLSGDGRAGLQHYRLALEAAARGGLQPHMAAVYRGGEAAALILLGRANEAADLYSRNRVYETERGARAQQASISLARAVHCRPTGGADYVAHLREGFAAAREYNLFHLLRALPGIVAELCSDALEAEIETAFVTKLVAMRCLAPPAGASDRWPWPVRVQCFGPFAVVLQGSALEAAGKAQNRPLELVKLLAANDDRPLPVARVLQLLWPDSDEDAARKAFDVALARLKKLLDSPDAYRIEGGRLAVDPALVHTDAGHFNRVASEVDAARLAKLPDAALLAASTMLTRLYRGAFLAHDPALPWVLEARERFKNRFLRSVEVLGARLEERGMAAEAIRLYDRATEVEPLSEGLYRRLMLAHMALGSPAEALRVYRRCREMLSILVSMPPSRETQSLMERISANP